MRSAIKVCGYATLALLAMAAMAFVGWQLVAAFGALLVAGFLAWVNWTLSLFPL